MARRPRRDASTRRSRSREHDAPASGGEFAVRIRHYCQGIGDSHLIRFPKADGGFFYLLIDCGVHSSVAGGTATIRSVVENIAAVTERIDVLVVTHEHWDHVSGFLTAAAEFRNISIGQVWMPWTENGEDELAREFDTFRGAALAALQQVGQKLDHVRGLAGQMAGLRDGLQALLGFQFGAKGERVRAARDAAAAMAKSGKPLYLAPAPQPITVPEVPNLRIWVLGPARDRDTLRVGVRPGGTVRRPGNETWQVNGAAPSGQAGDSGLPFDAGVGTSLADAISGQAAAPVVEFVRGNYVGGETDAGTGPDAVSWRRIDADWMAPAAELAIRLDRGINNSSLVLAFDMVDTGRVLLFPGDAQAESWLSWQGLSWTIGGETVTAADLLARTIYLKAAHHGSRNGMIGENGLDLMSSPDLAAFVPTSEADARKLGWGEMPSHALLSALRQRTSGRLIRADDPWIRDPTAVPCLETPAGSLRALRRGDGLWVEVDVS